MADFEISFVCKEIPETMFYELTGKGFNVLKIADEAQFFSLLTNDCIVVLDGYGFDTEYQKQIKENKCQLVCIDDLHDKEFVADLIINHSTGIVPQDYKALPQTQFALGLDYVLLRPAFLEQTKCNRVIEKIETILICFGGSDFKNLTQQTLSTVLQFSNFSKIIVITGVAYELTYDFIRLVKSDKRIDHRSDLNEAQMLAAMLEAELAIVPASGILLEAIAAGCIVLSGLYVENQRFVYENIVKSGLVLDGGGFEPEQIIKSLNQALEETKTERRIGIDGKSSIRIQKLFKQIQIDFNITIRSALPSDVDTTFSWANRAEIRQFSFNQQYITESEHREWFLRKLNDPTCRYYIFEYKGSCIGSIRFDIDIKSNEAVISYLLDPTYHGQDLGTLLLKNGIERLLCENTEYFCGFDKISGYVINANIPSVKSFEKLGFTKGESSTTTIKFTKRIW